MCIQPYSQVRNQGLEGRPPLPFLKIEKSVLIFEKKERSWLHLSLGYIFYSKLVLRVSRRKKTPKCSPARPLFCCFWQNLYRRALVPQTSPSLLQKIYVCTPALWHSSCCKTLYLECLTVFWIRLCLDNCSDTFTITLWYVLHQTPSEFWYIQHCFFRYVPACLIIFSVIEAYSCIFRHY